MATKLLDFWRWLRHFWQGFASFFVNGKSKVPMPYTLHVMVQTISVRRGEDKKWYDNTSTNGPVLVLKQVHPGKGIAVRSNGASYSVRIAELEENTEYLSWNATRVRLEISDGDCSAAAPLAESTLFWKDDASLVNTFQGGTMVQRKVDGVVQDLGVYSHRASRPPVGIHTMTYLYFKILKDPDGGGGGGDAPLQIGLIAAAAAVVVITIVVATVALLRRNAAQKKQNSNQNVGHTKKHAK